MDAPALQDDFYLNLVDWSSHNVLAVGLDNCVYLWNACSSKVSEEKILSFGVQSVWFEVSGLFFLVLNAGDEIV